MVLDGKIPGLAYYDQPFPQAGYNSIVEIQKAAVLWASLVAANGGALPVVVTSGAGGAPAQAVGVTNQHNDQLTTSGSAQSAVAARPTRTGVTFINIDATNTIYLGPAGVTSGNGIPLPPGASITLTWVGAIFAICGGGTPILGFWDEYN